MEVNTTMGPWKLTIDFCLHFIPLDSEKSIYICCSIVSVKSVPNLWSTMGSKCKDFPPLLAVLQLYMLHFWVGHKSQMAFIHFLVVRSS